MQHVWYQRFFLVAKRFIFSTTDVTFSFYPKSNTPTFSPFVFPGDIRVSAIVIDSGSHSLSRTSDCHLQYATFHECTQTELAGGCGICD